LKLLRRSSRSETHIFKVLALNSSGNATESEAKVVVVHRVHFVESFFNKNLDKVIAIVVIIFVMSMFFIFRREGPVIAETNSRAQWETWFNAPEHFTGAIPDSVKGYLPDIVTNSAKNRLFIKMVLETKDPTLGDDRMTVLKQTNWLDTAYIDNALKQSFYKTNLVDSLQE
jgi:hypothetical protein